MSGQATGWVFRHGPTDRAQRMVLLTIADAANRDGEHAKPGMEAIINGSLYSEAHCHRVLVQLTLDQWIEQTEKPGPGKYAEWRIPPMADEIASHSDRRSEATPSKRLANASPLSDRRSEDDTVLPITENVERDARDFDPLRGFDHFWKVYPPRNGRKLDKNKAAEKWRKLSLDDRRAAYRGAKNLAADVAANGSYPKNAERWLRDRCWDDWQECAEEKLTAAELERRELFAVLEPR